jgi:hypothetical protein
MAGPPAEPRDSDTSCVPTMPMISMDMPAPSAGRHPGDL